MVLLRAAVRLLMLLGCVASGVPAAAGDLEDGRREFVEPHMGTLFRIVLYAPPGVDGSAAAKAAFARVEALNRVLSDYDPESEAMRLCREPAGATVPVSTDLFSVLTQARNLAVASGGAFDVTLGPLTLLWRTSRRSGVLPDPVSLAAARDASGFAHLHLDEARRSVRLQRTGMRLDFGGIAKGFAADAALAVLAQHGVARALVAASGDLALGEPPPGKEGWTVALEPFGSPSDPPPTLVLANAGVSTSGDTEQSVTLGGVRYSHIVDPATGLGLTRRVAVTVVARQATLTDGLATACSVLDADRTRALVEALPEPAHVMVHERHPDGSVQCITYGRPPAPFTSSSP
ncbi:MAG: FAD:protein FMN transferase [Opitutaceae bacterium]